MQLAVFLLITLAIALLTWWQCRGAPRNRDDNTEYFLAGRGLRWYFVAGSITLTNLSTDQLVGMNGNQMMLLAWWEIAAVLGLLILALVFVPIYYRYSCTTTTELLEKRYGNPRLRSLVSVFFLLGNVILYLPIMLYTGSLFLKSMFNLDLSTVLIAAALAALGSSYAIFGGLRAVAVSDTISGIGLLSLSLLIVWLAVRAIGFDFSSIPPERMTLIGGPESPIPWPTLLTGMVFIQIFYWSTNQTITQRAMAAPTVAEAQKGVLAAAAIRLLIVPVIIVVPGVCAYQLYGDIGDATYGRLVADLLPGWLSGTFAAMMVAAVLTSFNSVLNSSTTLYVMDLHESMLNRDANVHRLNIVVSLCFVVVAVALVPVYDGAESIINLVQQLNGLLSMPILSVFIVGLLFSNVAPGAAGIALVSGVALYSVFTFLWTPLHYIHLMAITLGFCLVVALLLNRLLFQRRAVLAIARGWGR
jgi:SSS family solute:Na+ symporter